MPVTVTIPTILVLFITVWNILRLYSLINNREILVEFGANPIFLLVIAFLWVLIGLMLTFSIWIRWSISISIFLGFGVSYYLWYWIDRFFFQDSTTPNFTFSAIFSTSLLTFFCVLLLAPSSKAFFIRSNNE